VRHEEGGPIYPTGSTDLWAKRFPDLPRPSSSPYQFRPFGRLKKGEKCWCRQGTRAIQSGKPSPFATSLVKPDCEPWPNVRFCRRRETSLQPVSTYPEASSIPITTAKAHSSASLRHGKSKRIAGLYCPTRAASSRPPLILYKSLVALVWRNGNIAADRNAVAFGS
jgi:hypothetical protein